MKKLSNETSVYRILLNQQFFNPDTQEILSEDFKRKYKQKINDVELSVKDIRDLGLDAIKDGEDHVSIIIMA